MSGLMAVLLQYFGSFRDPQTTSLCVGQNTFQCQLGTPLYRWWTINITLKLSNSWHYKHKI